MIVHHRQRQIVLAAHQASDFFLVERRGDARHLVTHDLIEARGGRLENQVPHRQHAHQMPPTVDDVDVKHQRRLLAHAAQLGNRLLDGHLLGQRRDLGGHDAAGRVGWILLELAHLLGDGNFHLVDDRVVHLGADALEQIDAIVGVHRRDHHRSLGRLHLRDHLGGARRVHLGKDAPGSIGIEVLGDAGCLRQRQVRQDLGAIGGGHFFNALRHLARLTQHQRREAVVIVGGR